MEHFGPDVALSAITNEAMEGFCTVLKRYPINSAQRFKGLNLPDAIRAADAKANVPRLNARTIANNFERIISLFTFAVEKRLMLENPAKDRFTRERFGKRPEREPKAQFTIAPAILPMDATATNVAGCPDDVAKNPTSTASDEPGSRVADKNADPRRIQ